MLRGIITTTIILWLLTFKLSAQVFEYKNIPDSIDTYADIKIQNTGKLIDLTTYLPNNHVTDGSEDYTLYIQKGLSENNEVIFPSFPILINDNGLDLRNNSKVIFPENSKLLLNTSNKRSYEILRIHNKKNIAIYSPNILGDKYHHDGDTGEWGMGISIRGSKNISVFNPYISECWGDGIYVGFSKKHSQNVRIEGGVIDNNRRNGISVISVDSLVIQNVLISNSNGTDPQTGIDIEPNSSSDEINNIIINDLITFNNYHNGVLIHLDKLPGKVRKDVNIKINGFMDILSGRAVRVSGTYRGDKKESKPLRGKIIFENITTDKSNKKSVFNQNDFFPSVLIKDTKGDF